MVDRTNPRNQLSIGSDVEIAYKVAELLSDKLGQIVFTEGQFWFYKKTAWEPITTTTLERCVRWARAKLNSQPGASARSFM